MEGRNPLTIWIITTNKRKYKIGAKRRIDAENRAWLNAEIGEEIFYIVPEESV
jgi:hypothetical protein